MIIPCGHRVIVKQMSLEEADSTYKTNLILVGTDRVQDSIDMGTVVSIGPSAWKDFGTGPWCKVGDTVAFAKYAGKTVKDLDTQEKYQALNDEDIICVLREGN